MSAVTVSRATGNDTMTSVDGTQTEVAIDLAAIQNLTKTSSKKKKKKKLSEAEKALVKIEKKADELKNNPEDYKNFISKVERWLSRHKTQLRAVRLFQQFDINDEDTISYDEFKAGMLDLNCPCTSTELHVLARLLDTDTNHRVHYKLLENGLQVARTQEEMYRESDVKPELLLTNSQHKHCAKCKLITYDGENFKEKYPRYIQAELRLQRFANIDHPHHVTIVVEGHMTMHILANLIKQETHIITSQVSIYKNLEDKIPLSPDRRLEDDYQGGNTDNPTRVILYYDYESEFSDCPLLMSDYYIGMKEKSTSDFILEEGKSTVKNIKKS